MMRVLALTVAFLLQAQTVPYLVIPRTRPELRSSVSSAGTAIMKNPTTVPATSSTTPLRQVRTGILDLVNTERTKRGLAGLKENPLLTTSAQKHAEDMVKRKFFSHVNPDGLQSEDRIRAVGYFTAPCERCHAQFSFGENMARGQKSATDVVHAWMHSAVHRGNILKPEFTDIGVGYTGGIWVQNFGGIAVGR